MDFKKCKKSYWILVLLVFLVFPVFSPVMIAAPEAEQGDLGKFSLEACVAYAWSHHPLMERTRIEEKKSLLLLDEVRRQILLPEFSLSGQAGVVPEARGDIFSSPDKQTDLDGWGPFYKLDVKLVQPLFTFGRKSSALTAARSGIDLQSIAGNAEIEKLTLTVINAYWALAAAQKAETVAGEIRENYDKLEEEVKKRLESDDSLVDDTDLLEVKSNRYLVEEMVIKSKTEKQLATKAMNAAVGREITAGLDVSEEKTPGISLEESQLSRILRETVLEHRELRGLDAALQGLRAKTKLAYSQKRPLVYLAGGFAYAYAPKRQDQTNPFAVDNFNYLNLGAFFGVSWDLNFFRKNIEARRNGLEREAMEQNREMVQTKIELEILKAFGEVKQNAQLLEQARDSLKSAKNWLRLSMDNWDMGIGEVERLIKAYNAYYQLKGVEIKRTLELHISIANFAYFLGNIRLCLEWVKNEKIDLL
jgi:outer membrane protein